MIAGVESFPLLAVPFFILAGNLMNIAGVTGRIYRFAVALVGWMRGGLGHVNIIGSVIFSGMSGTAIADAAGLGTIEIKAMKDHGYPTEFSVGVTAASATLGPDHPAVAAIRDLRHDGERLDRRAVSRRRHSRRRHDAADDGHRGLFRPQEQLGQRHAVLLAAVGSAGLEIVVVLGFPMAVWLLVLAGLSTNMARCHRPRRVARARLVLRLLRRDGADGAGHPDRRHDARLVHADGSRGRRRDLVAVPRPGPLPHHDVADGGEGDLRHHRDHGVGAVHRHGGLDLRLAADGVAGGAELCRT